LAAPRRKETELTRSIGATPDVFRNLEPDRF